MKTPLYGGCLSTSTIHTIHNTYWYRVGLVYLEFSRLVLIAVHSPGQQVQEHPQQVKVSARDVGYLENGTDPRNR